MSSVFRALRHRNYRLHFTGQTISLMGTWMQRVAMSWLVYRATDSALMLGVVTFAGLIPTLLLSPFAGSFADRHNRYRTLIFTQTGMMLQAGTLAILVWFNWYTIWVIVLLALIQGVISVFDVTSRQSLIRELVPVREDLANAIALNSSVFNAARMVGPAIGGIVLSTYGEAACFALNFFSYIAVLLTLCFMRLSFERTELPEEHWWAGLREGYSYLRRSPHVSSLILLLACSSLLLIPFTTLLPVIARELFHGDARTFSWFESAAGLGAMSGAVYMAAQKPGKNLRFLVIGAAAAFAVAVFVLSLVPVLWTALLCTLLAGMAMMIQNSSINTYIQTHVPGRLRGRAISYYVMAFQGVLPLGSLLIGFLGHTMGVGTTLILEGIAGLGIAAAFAFHLWRKLSQ